jgi:hypothetical protein
MLGDDGDEVYREDAHDGMGPAYGRPLVERLLLSLIDAHPRTETQHQTERYFSNREKRLRTAMKALFSEKPSQKLLDDAALFWMAKEHILDRAKRSSADWKAKANGPSDPPGSTPPLRSERELAEQASKTFYPAMSDKSERLRKKWERGKRGWLDVAKYHDDLPELFETQALAKSWVALARAKISVVPNSPNGSAMTEHQMLRSELPALRELVEVLKIVRAPASGGDAIR